VFNEYDLTRNFISNLLTYIPNYNKIIFVNSICEEHPETTEMLTQLADIRPGIETIVLEKRWWTSALWNIGLKNVNSKYVLMIDNDIIFHNDFLTPMLTTMKDKSIAWVGPIYLDQQGNPQHVGATVNENYAFDRQKYNVIRLPLWQFNQYADLGWVYPILFTTSSCALFRMKALKDIGFFDERLYTAIEQYLGFSFWSRDWRIVVQPRSVVKHLESYTKSKWKTLTRTPDWPQEMKKYEREHFNPKQVLSILFDDVRDKVLEKVKYERNSYNRRRTEMAQRPSNPA